ncbi:hypothetical protein PV327_004176, partial [Microctonus hyperodae]
MLIRWKSKDKSSSKSSSGSGSGGKKKRKFGREDTKSILVLYGIRKDWIQLPSTLMQGPGLKHGFAQQ